MEKFKQIAKRIGKILLYIAIFWHVLVILYAFLPVPLTPLMLQRCVEQAIDGRPIKMAKSWTSLEDISEDLQLAVVCAEDQKFLEHDGFDFEAIEKAIEANKKRKKKGKAVRGASTISQQVAKNTFLFPQRSWIRKGLEVYFTFLIETIWSKERIMEVYLNVAEMGEGIYGAQAASQTYFKKEARDISASQAATLAAILPNPRVYSAATPSGYVIKRRNWIMRQMAHWGELDFEKE